MKLKVVRNNPAASRLPMAVAVAEISRAAIEQLRIPAHILTLQYVGVPLSGHIGKSTQGRYNALRPLGPNDGLTLLADELVPDGIVITDVGLDHYYRDAAIATKTLALAYVVLDELEWGDIKGTDK